MTTLKTKAKLDSQAFRHLIRGGTIFLTEAGVDLILADIGFDVMEAEIDAARDSPARLGHVMIVPAGSLDK